MDRKELIGIVAGAFVAGAMVGGGVVGFAMSGREKIVERIVERPVPVAAPSVAVPVETSDRSSNQKAISTKIDWTETSCLHAGLVWYGNGECHLSVQEQKRLKELIAKRECGSLPNELWSEEKKQCVILYR
jgi:hypothetical protein